MNLTKTQKNILSILLVSPSSTRGALAKSLSLTNAALTLALKPLLKEGMVKEERNLGLSQKAGRKELRISLNPEYGCFLGVDVRKHHAYFSLVDFSGALIAQSDDGQNSLLSFCASSPKKILGIGVALRGNASEESLEERFPALAADLKKLGIPYFVFNNVDCLSSIYSLFHSEESNFLLVKYGPGLGSSVYAHGKPIGSSSELGHTFYQDKTVEETISYLALLGQEYDEKEGYAKIKENQEILAKVLTVLSFALCNADSLLSLQKVILSGALLSDNEVIEKLKTQIRLLSGSFDLSKIVVYENYQSINERKGALGAFIKTFVSF